jgi:alpha-beta hydrolase superfamily lysophospholipase
MNKIDSENSSGTIITIPYKEHKIDALFNHIVTNSEHVTNKPVILRLHGLLGNLLDETEHDLPQILAKHGYSSITMNTSLANLGLFFGFGFFEDVMPQIDAACDYLRKVGFQKIVIAGHGVGGCMAIRYGAWRNQQSPNPDIHGVIGIATAYSLPDTIRKRWERFGSQPTYQEVYEKAKQIFQPLPGKEPLDDETIVVTSAHGPTRRPEHSEIYTLKTWWALAGPEAEGPKAHRHIGNISVPILLVHGTKDELIAQQEFEALGNVAKAAGNQDVTMLNLEAGHNLAGKHEELGQGIVNWLQKRCEPRFPV